MMKLIEFESGAQNIHAPSYVCSQTDFVQTTDVADGAELQVVDESAHKVVGYYMAFNGYWNAR